MCKFIVFVFVIFDGVIQLFGNLDEDFVNGFIYGGWFWLYVDEVIDVMENLFWCFFELLLGCCIYDVFVGFWLNVVLDLLLCGIVDLFNCIIKYVVIYWLGVFDWDYSCNFGIDVVVVVCVFKQSDGLDLFIQGSSELVQQLLVIDLVDELILIVVLILFGIGKCLFDECVQLMVFWLLLLILLLKGNVVMLYVCVGEVLNVLV